MEKGQDLRPCFLSIQLRQGRSLWLPTLPYQRTNRYAVDGVLSVFHLLHFRIGYTNSYEVVSAIPAFVSFGLCISQTNRYAVVGVMPVLHLLHPHIGWSLARLNSCPSIYCHKAITACFALTTA